MKFSTAKSVNTYSKAKNLQHNPNPTQNFFDLKYIYIEFAVLYSMPKYTLSVFLQNTS